MYQDTCTNKNDDSFLHLEAGHDLVAPYDPEQRRKNKWLPLLGVQNNFTS